MASETTRHDADLAAEANHFRIKAIRQELETGERMRQLIDPASVTLPPAAQVGRPAFSRAMLRRAIVTGASDR